jgi:nucleotide-binding universal stress UspA family protein
VQGTVICGVSDTNEGQAALRQAVDLSERLGLRLVLAHVVKRRGARDDDAEAMNGKRQSALHMLARLARAYGVAETANCREAVGDPAASISRIAAEEAADLIVVGARARGRLRRGFESRLAEELEAETPVPVLIAPPLPRRGLPALRATHG